MRLLKLLCIAFFAMGTQFSIAAEKVAGSGPNPYSDCGIGAALFDNDTGATISNVIWDLGTTALISATASPETCEGANAEAAMMIFETYDVLEEETAKGGGQHIAAVLDTLGCQKDIRENLTSAVRSDFADALEKEDYVSNTEVEKAEAYYNILMNQIGSNYQSSCKLG